MANHLYGDAMYHSYFLFPLFTLIKQFENKSVGCLCPHEDFIKDKHQIPLRIPSSKSPVQDPIERSHCHQITCSSCRHQLRYHPMPVSVIGHHTMLNRVLCLQICVVQYRSVPFSMLFYSYLQKIKLIVMRHVTWLGT